MSTWNTGTPQHVPVSHKETLWCAIRWSDGVICHRPLVWVNHGHFDLSDSCDEVPEDAVDDGDGGYYYTGWMEPCCDSCETSYPYHSNVVAWMILPRYTPDNQPPIVSSTPW
jgi:hypothetical protein